MHISSAKAAYDVLEAAGHRVPINHRLGDGLANSGEFNQRHNGVLRKKADMVTAVAVGSIILGDKDDVARTAMLNAGHAVDLAELSGDDDTGGDCNYEQLELKVPSPLVPTYSAGQGSGNSGGAPQSVGHLYSFGSTREKYHLKILGCAARGKKEDGALNHATGKGWVAEHRGDYYDAIHLKRIKR